MALIEKCNGDVHIAELENETGYTSRYINRLFKNQLGISTKDFAKFVRFQAVINKMNSGSKENLAGLAAEFGDFDQSHFHKEFKEFTSVTPHTYKVFVDLPNYQKKIVDCSFAFNRA
jgi:methylphosphotriester-DNA--protein-cysteine methyltransferase